jgi:transposase
MRGEPDRQPPLFHVFEVEDRIRPDHPLRDLKRRTDRILAGMAGRFAAAYSRTGRPSVPPERLLKALLLMALYSIRSERQLCEQIDVNLLYRWFIDLHPSEDAFDATTFGKNRERLKEHGLTKAFFDAVVAEALTQGLCSEHFSVDGTLLNAWASHKSFKPKDGPPSEPPAGRNAEVQWHGQKRSNDTHASTTDPDARLYRKSHNTAATLCYSGHLLMENRNALIVDAELTFADGYTERATALEMLGRLPTTVRRRTVAGDKGYDTKGFVAEARALGFTPHLAQNNTRQRSAIDGRTTRHDGHATSIRIRKRIEEPFGWIKTIAGGRQLRYRGRDRNRAWFKIAAAVYNMIRITALDTQRALA